MDGFGLSLCTEYVGFFITRCGYVGATVQESCDALLIEDSKRGVLMLFPPLSVSYNH